jgi:hypothetical protein
LLLGLCRANDTNYAQLLVDKMLFMLPGDQARLRDCMTYRSLLDEYLLLAQDPGALRKCRGNVTAFLEVLDLYGRISRQHHDQLVNRFIEGPAEALDAQHHKGLTASGPPLPVLLRSLALLRDMRMAVARDDVATRNADVTRLRQLVQSA